MMPGINLERTVFPIRMRGGGPGGLPDVADILYVVHRCHHGHGEPLPVGYELIPDTTTEPPRTTMNMKLNPAGDWVLRLSDRSIFGMLAVALLSPANVGQVLDGVRLTYSSVSGDVRLWLDNGWWGRADDFAAITAMDGKRISKTLNFTNVMPAPKP